MERAYVVSKAGVKEAEGEVVSEERPLYSVGFARKVRVRLGRGEYLAVLKLVRNPRGVVKGYVEVYDASGVVVFRAAYRKLKLRRSFGDPKYAWVVESLVRHLKMPIKRLNLR